jgi:aminopeptidase YwaD
MKKLLFLVILFTYSLFSQTEFKRSTEITGDEIIGHIKYLSSEKLQGRRTGEKWCDSAGAYIEREFSSYGLKPFNNSFRQIYEVIYSVTAGTNNTLKFSGVKTKTAMNTNFVPLSFSSSGKTTGNLIFAGYGISYPDSNYDDYANIDVKDKIVIILLGLPDDTPGNKFQKFENPRYKATIARDKGARAVIFCSVPNKDGKDELPKLINERSSSKSGIPMIQISSKLTEALFAADKKDIKLIQEQINKNLKPASFEFTKMRTDISVEIIENKRNTFNVIGYLEGNDPTLKNEYIVLGAHYDHLGLGGESSLAPDVTAVHCGADDNASGSSGVLELAQYFSANRNKFGRSIIFMSFSGEEEGLLGSANYVKYPDVPLEKTSLMINMDMIGRLKDKKLIVNGVGSSTLFTPLLNKYNRDSIFVLKLIDDGFSPSDNSSFYGKNIPVLMFFTDLHSDYHKPSDTWDKINVTGEKNVLDLVKNITIDLSNEKSKIEFVKAKSDGAPKRDMPGFRVSTGIIPDFGEQVEGLKIQGTRDGSPSNKAGLKSGDIIIKFGSRSIKNLQDYAFALGEHKPGEKVTVIWIRDGKEMTGVMDLVKK